jgi:hypothetical protein
MLLFERREGADLAAIGSGGEQLKHGELEGGMAKGGSELGHGNEDEAAFGHARVRDFKLGGADDAGAVYKDVEIDGARTGADHAAASEFALDTLNEMKKLARHQRSFGFDGQIEKPTLRSELHWFGEIERGLPHDAHACFSEARESAIEMRDAIAEVRSEGEVDGVGGHGGR